MTTEEQYKDLQERAKARGLWVGIYLSIRPPDLKEGDFVELPPMRVVDVDTDLAPSLDLIEKSLADWEAHPLHPLTHRPRASFKRGYVLGFGHGTAVRAAAVKETETPA